MIVPGADTPHNMGASTRIGRSTGDWSCRPSGPANGSQFIMIAPETFDHIDHIKKRAGHLWRFL
jgi:hypothetical protein